MSTLARSSIDFQTDKARHRTWSWERLIGAWVVAALWLCSWTWLPSRQLWNAIDIGVFQTANALVARSAIFRTICAATNAQLFDIVAVAATVCLLAYAASAHKRPWQTEVLSVLLLIIAVTSAKFVIADGVLGKWCQYHRASPTLALDSVRVSALEDWIETKDSSHYCFPSDHGIVLVAVAIYVVMRAPNKSHWAIGYLLIFAAPRVMSGAHWLTDIVVGSAFVAFAAVSLLLMTPLQERGVKWLSEVALRGARYGRRWTKWPSP